MKGKIKPGTRKYIIFTLQTILGAIIAHAIPTCMLWVWIPLSITIGHFINNFNYK